MGGSQFSPATPDFARPTAFRRPAAPARHLRHLAIRPEQRPRRPAEARKLRFSELHPVSGAPRAHRPPSPEMCLGTRALRVDSRLKTESDRPRELRRNERRLALARIRGNILFENGNILPRNFCLPPVRAAFLNRFISPSLL